MGYSREPKSTEIWNQKENWLTNYHVKCTYDNAREPP